MAATTLAKILQKIYKAVLLSLGVVSGIAVAETFSEVNVTIPQDINTSFIGIYANSALYPMPKQTLFSTADMILYPERYDTLSMGITFTPPVVVNNSMKIRELFYGKPFVEFIALKDSGISRFEMSEISPELSGSLAVIHMLNHSLGKCDTELMLLILDGTVEITAPASVSATVA